MSEYETLKEMALVVSQNKMFGKSKEEALALMMVAQAEGVHPMQAILEWDLIQGKPALKSTALMARFQKAGGRIEYIERTDSVCEAKFSHPQGANVTVRWDLAKAEKAGLAGKANWKSFSGQMLAARCIAEGVRACYPAVLSNLHTDDELMEITPTDYERIAREEFPDLDLRLAMLQVRPTYEQIVSNKEAFRVKTAPPEGA